VRKQRKASCKWNSPNSSIYCHDFMVKESSYLDSVVGLEREDGEKRNWKRNKDIFDKKFMILNENLKWSSNRGSNTVSVAGCIKYFKLQLLAIQMLENQLYLID